MRNEKTMEIQVISLVSRPDRRQKLEEQMRAQGAKYTIWEGILTPQKPSKGIALAHQRIVAWAKSQGLPKVTIAEDDVAFSAPGAIDWYWRQEPETYDLYLGGITYGQVKEANVVDDFAGTHFYTIQSKFYDHFLSLTGERNIDRALAHRGRFIVCNPMIAYQVDGYSDNRKSNVSFKPYWKNRSWWGRTG
jgi:hypothetical protein